MMPAMTKIHLSGKKIFFSSFKFIFKYKNNTLLSVFWVLFLLYRYRGKAYAGKAGARREEGLSK